MLPKEDRYYATRSELLDQLKTLLGGRVAEALVLKEISTGAQNDLERATDLVRKMITQWGMSEKLGPITFGRRQEQVFLGRDIAQDRNYSEEVAFTIDQEVRRIIEDGYKQTEEMLQQNLEKLTLMANALLERETLEAEELEQLMHEGKITAKEPSDDEAPPAPADAIDEGTGPKIVYITRP